MIWGDSSPVMVLMPTTSCSLGHTSDIIVLDVATSPFIAPRKNLRNMYGSNISRLRTNGNHRFSEMKSIPRNESLLLRKQLLKTLFLPKYC